MEMYQLDEIDFKTKSKQATWFLSHYGLCCTEIKDHGKSIDLCTMAIPVMEFAWGKKANNSKIFGHCLSNMARDFELKEDYEKARSSYEAAHDGYDKATEMKEEKKKLSIISYYIDRVSQELKKTKNSFNKIILNYWLCFFMFSY